MHGDAVHLPCVVGDVGSKGEAVRHGGAGGQPVRTLYKHTHWHTHTHTCSSLPAASRVTTCTTQVPGKLDCACAQRVLSVCILSVSVPAHHYPPRNCMHAASTLSCGHTATPLLTLLQYCPHCRSRLHGFAALFWQVSQLEAAESCHHTG